MGWHSTQAKGEKKHKPRRSFCENRPIKHFSPSHQSRHEPIPARQREANSFFQGTSFIRAAAAAGQAAFPASLSGPFAALLEGTARRLAALGGNFSLNVANKKGQCQTYGQCIVQLCGSCCVGGSNFREQGTRGFRVKRLGYGGRGKMYGRPYLLVGVHACEAARVAGLAALASNLLHLLLGAVGKVARVRVLSHGFDGGC